MDVELLVVPGCPHEVATFDLLRAMLDELGRPDVGIRTTVIVGPDEAADQRFGGSPTVRIDDVDPFPAGSVPAVACRLYRTETGWSSVPGPEVVRTALREAIRQGAPNDRARTDSPPPPEAGGLLGAFR